MDHKKDTGGPSQKSKRKLSGSIEVRYGNSRGPQIFSIERIQQLVRAGHRIVYVAREKKNGHLVERSWYHSGKDLVTDEETTPLTNDERRAALKRSLSCLPDSYSDCHNMVSDLNHFFHEKAAAVLGPRLNELLKTKPHDSYAEKQALASWVNNELRQLGLAIRDPKTSKPAILVADVQGGEDSPSRFRFEIRGENGARKRTFSSRLIPELTLMEDDVRLEPLSKTRQR